MGNERFYDSFLDMVQEEVDVNTLLKGMKYIEDDGYGKSRRKEEVDGTSNDIIPKVSLTALMAKARKVSKKRAWIKKEEIKAAVGDEMDDKTFEKYWEDRKTKYVRSRHIEFGKDAFGNEIVSTGRRGLVPRPKDDSDLDEFLSSLRGEEGGETVNTDNLMEAAFTDGDPVFMNDYTSQLEDDDNGKFEDNDGMVFESQAKSKKQSSKSSSGRETLFEDIADDEDEEFKSNFRRKSKDGYSLEFEIGDEDCGCGNCDNDFDDDDSDQEFKGGYDYKAADGEDRTEDFAAHLNSLVDFVKDHEWDAVEKALAPETLAKKKIFMVADFHKKLSDLADAASTAAKDDDESAEKSNVDKMTKEIEKMLNKVD